MDQNETPENSHFYEDAQSELRNKLRDLIDQHEVWTMKLSTEDAGMPFPDLRERYRLFGDLLPLQLKIGGPEARNDIRIGAKIGCQALIAPMVESPYGLKNFINASREVLGRRAFEAIDLQINIETRLGAQNISEILALEEANHLSQITVGRHDLCRSMDLKPNEEAVLDAVDSIVKSAQNQGIRTSVGGRITPGDAKMISDRIQPDKINTRELGFHVKTLQQARKTVRSILDFERKLLVYERSYYRKEDERLTERIKKLEGRKNR